MTITLVILAATMGNRYGGLKYLEPIGPHGETILDYSVYDAIKAGFTRIVFVINPSFEKEYILLRKKILTGSISYQSVCQSTKNKKVSKVFQSLHF